MITVQPGDSLARIAFENDTTVEALVAANVERYPSLRDRPDLIQVGWLLSLPAEVSPGASEAARPAYRGLRFGLEEEARGGQVADGVIQSVLPPPGDHHMCALFGKELRTGEPNAAVATGNYGDLSVQTGHNPPLLLETGMDLAFLFWKISMDKGTSFFPKTIE